MGDLMPILEVTTGNIEKLYPAILAAIEACSFVGIDCELSGLGERRKINFSEIDMRYQFSVESAKKHSIISLGLSCFICKTVSNFTLPHEQDVTTSIKSHNYIVQTFNILTLCEDDYMLEFAALKFLLHHGFDFNKQYREGLQYRRGNTEEIPKDGYVRRIFNHILKCKKPIVIHNGMIDLVFMYQSFYADAPKNLDTFAADLFDMFPSGIYDTKYLAEYTQKMPATYLEYLYKKMQLRNAKKANCHEWQVRVNFPPYPSDLKGIDWLPYKQIYTYSSKEHGDKQELCESYAYHGWCYNGSDCNKSHNIDRIVKELTMPAYRKRGFSKRMGPVGGPIPDLLNRIARRAKRKISEEGSSKRQRVRFRNSHNGASVAGRIVVDSESSDSSEDEAEPYSCTVLINNDSAKEKPGTKEENATVKSDVSVRLDAVGHRAGFDAFMTGYIFACYIADAGLLKEPKFFTPIDIGMNEAVNKVYLVGKNIPFLVRTGTFAKYSPSHAEMIAKIR